MGILYVIATPIGNLGDITKRAIDSLKNSDLIACENKKRALKLLNHLGIKKRLITYNESNEINKSAFVIDLIKRGKSIALISDAGTPLISDPGYRLVKKARAEKLPVVPIPGPCALIAALSVAALPTDSFYFIGFLPRKKGNLRKKLEELKNIDTTFIIYESPHRLEYTLNELFKIWKERKICLAREITKINEEFIIGNLSEIIKKIKKRKSIYGEITIVIGPPDIKSN